MDLSYFPSECCIKKVARNWGGKKILLLHALFSLKKD